MQIYGHDLDARTPLTKQRRVKMNPAGRAILKAAQYCLPEEEINQEHPLLLSTGCRIHHARALPCLPSFR